jgi:hypothetical protein
LAQSYRDRLARAIYVLTYSLTILVLWLSGLYFLWAALHREWSDGAVYLCFWLIARFAKWWAFDRYRNATEAPAPDFSAGIGSEFRDAMRGARIRKRKDAMVRAFQIGIVLGIAVACPFAWWVRGLIFVAGMFLVGLVVQYATIRRQYTGD